jgi:hypothetical protein
MPDVAVQKVKDLQADARRAVQNLLGRELRDEEQVSIRVSAVYSSPSRKVRREAAARLARLVDQAAEKASHIPDQALETLIDETMDHVRPRKKR